MSICLYGDIGLIAGPVSRPGEDAFVITTRDSRQVTGQRIGELSPVAGLPEHTQHETLSTKGVSMAPPRPKDSFPHRPPALPAASIVQLMPGAFIGLVDHLRKDTGD